MIKGVWITPVLLMIMPHPWPPHRALPDSIPKQALRFRKLVYVHEGIEPDAPKSKRHHLVHPRYFAGVCGESENNKELYAALRHGTKAEFNEIVDRIRGCLPDETGVARVEEARVYFLNNWMPARRRLLHQDGVIGCSAEGQVSHLLSGRMSSRPMGWSRTGARKMARLRAYYQNGGSMLELVRRQSRQLPKAAGGEDEVIDSASEMLREERKNRKANGKYIDRIQASIMPGAAKHIHLEKFI